MVVKNHPKRGRLLWVAQEKHMLREVEEQRVLLAEREGPQRCSCVKGVQVYGKLSGKLAELDRELDG